MWKDPQNKIIEKKRKEEKKDDPYFVTWEDDFRENISIDQRGQMPKTSARLKRIHPLDLTKRALFKFFPLKHIINSMFSQQL